jgi:phosphate transport system permease protein
LSPRTRDLRLGIIVRGAAACAAVVTLLVAAFVVMQAGPALRTVGVARWFTDDVWQPTSGRYGLTPMIVGTGVVTLGSVLVAGPIGVLSGVFCRFYAPRRVAAAYRQVIGLLAGIPSVVYGLWGLAVLVPLIAKVRPPGASVLAGIAVLSMMTLPTIALASDAALTAVSDDLLRGGAALGLGRRALAWSIAVPAARSGLVVGVLLQTARAIGETMAVLLVCGNLVAIPTSVFDPVRTLTANIALEMGYATSLHRSALFVTGLALLVVIVALVLFAERSTRRERG